MGAKESVNPIFYSEAVSQLIADKFFDNPKVMFVINEPLDKEKKIELQGKNWQVEKRIGFFSDKYYLTEDSGWGLNLKKEKEEFTFRIIAKTEGEKNLSRVVRFYTTIQAKKAEEYIKLFPDIELYKGNFKNEQEKTNKKRLWADRVVQAYKIYLTKQIAL